jgi:hypothetical protein
MVIFFTLLTTNNYLHFLPSPYKFLSKALIMHISNILLILSAAAASLATPVANVEQADFEAIASKYNIELTEAGASDFTSSAVHCYGGGPTWGGDKSYALDRAGRWCSGNGGAQSYRAGQKKGGCYNLASNKKVNFEIQNLQAGDVSLSSEACFRFTRGVINSCSRGGRNNNGAWEWRSDANFGKC